MEAFRHGRRACAPVVITEGRRTDEGYRVFLFDSAILGSSRRRLYRLHAVSYTQLDVYKRQHLASMADAVLPGIGECRILAGTDQPEEAADFYQNLGVTTVIVKNGADGAYVREGEVSYCVPG